MKSSQYLLVTAFLTSTAACGAAGEQPLGGSLRASSPSTPSYDVLTPAELPADVLTGALSGCSSDRMVAEPVDGGTCPTFTGWELTPLVGGYCGYQSDVPGDQLSGSELENFKAVKEDCLAVAPQRGSALEPVIGEDVRNAFAHRVGYLAEADLSLPSGVSTEGFRSPVTVAVVDTVPRTHANVLNSEHGEDLARVIKTLACPNLSSSSCAVAVERELGLPRVGHKVEDIDTAKGGYMGTFTDLARGIVSAVDEWDGTGHLVLNLSVGWEFEVFGGDHPGSDAVRSAAQYAYCHGALLVVSAGNDGGLCQDGLLAPAILASAPAPKTNRCTDLGVPPASQVLEGTAPLVHAIGGLGFGDDEMSGSRIGARTRVMATASHGMGGGLQLTTPLTGTSVSAAATSAAAAMVWSYNDSFTRAEVMDALYQGGEPLAFNADVTAVTDNGDVLSHRLNICGAMDHACGLNSACNLSLDCTLPSDQTDIDAIVLAAEAAATYDQDEDVTFVGESSCDPTICGVEISTPDLTDCARVSPDPVAAYADPQPGSTICSVCGVNGFTLTGSLDSHVDPLQINELLLVVTFPWSGDKKVYSLGRPAFTRTGILSMRVNTTALSIPNTTLTLVGLMSDGSTLENELLSHTLQP